MARSTARWLGIAALVAGYPLLAHYTNDAGHSGSLGAAVAVAPLALMALLLAWRSPRRPLMLGVLLLCGAAVWSAWPALERYFGVIYWLQDMAMLLVLLMTFARTLVSGRQPLCARLAEAVHSPVTPQHRVYARQVTVAWTGFFAAMAMTSTLLFFLTPLTIWSVFANLLTLPLIALMFIAEYGVRRWVLPDLHHAHILDAVRAFRNAPVPPREPSQP